MSGAENGVNRELSLKPVVEMAAGHTELHGDDGAEGNRYRRLLANALWSRNRRFYAGKIGERTCCRCRAADESTKHFLWECAANARRRAQLQVSFEQLPTCLSICGLVPMNLPGHLSVQTVMDVQRYLAETLQDWASSRDAEPGKALGLQGPFCLL